MAKCQREDYPTIPVARLALLLHTTQKHTRGGDRTHNLRLRKPTRFHCARARSLREGKRWFVVMLGLEPRTFALSERRSTD